MDWVDKKNKKGPLSDLELHGTSGILVFGRIAPQVHAARFFLFPLNLRGLKSHDHETWHVGPISDLELHRPSAILIFGRVCLCGCVCLYLSVC